MAHRYVHEEVEKQVRALWEKSTLYTTDLDDTTKEPYYLLFEFPYPSGDLHIGHWYAYAVTDIYARLQRMRGKNVLFPIGFDAFGLPAENAAMKQGANPKTWTLGNIEKMRSQVRSIGSSVDWSKEVVTCDPSYYKWTEWLFARLFEKGLVYRKQAPVKWCPKDATVLANEQVIDGKCERCDTEVEEKMLTQWFMKITAYADELLSELDTLPWREEIKEAQRAWIGKSEGAKLTFAVEGSDEGIEVFTTRPDTVFGATYIVLAPEHALIEALIARATNADAIRAYQEKTKKKTERQRSENKEKTGVELKGIKAINPATKEEIPVWVADYVLASYGTGAVMAVPAHDERDAEFAKNMSLPQQKVIESTEACYVGDGTLSNSGPFTGRNNREAYDEIIAFVGGEKKTNYRMRDWLVSRQRYWGCPIPIVYDPDGNPHYVGDENLPWLLPEDVDFTPTGKPPLASSKELHERVERIFGAGWTPEYDTLDTFVDSSWYYLRYLAPQDDAQFTDAKRVKKWMPVDRYSGGSEHTTMHVLYSRFFFKALRDVGLVEGSEPFTERYNRALILGSDGRKMSKRWGNVINPDEMVKAYGADAVRAYLAFIGPYNETGHYPWNLDGVSSMRKLLDRLYALKEMVVEKEARTDVLKTIAKAAKKVGEDSDRFKFNTALSALMVLTTALEDLEEIHTDEYILYLTLCAPFAPHITEHVYQALGKEGSIHSVSWPVFDSSLTKEDTATVIVQVNGKKRGEISISVKASEQEAVREARNIPAVAEALSQTLQKTVYVQGRILNFVVAP